MFLLKDIWKFSFYYKIYFTLGGDTALLGKV